VSDGTSSLIRFRSFPLTERPPEFIEQVVDVFRCHAEEIAPAASKDRFGSNAVLSVLRDHLVRIGFEIESGNGKAGRIERPVFFGENGEPSLQYQVDGYHPGWRCGLEVEAGRGLMGNAIYRNLIQAMVMTGVEHLVVAVLNCYQPTKAKSRDYEKSVAIASALFGHARLQLPFGLTVIGYGPHV
jgi:hypothetical protein